MIDLRTAGESRIPGIVRLAARRRLAVLIFQQLAFALAPVLAGFVILLLLGTQILNWYWLALLATGGLAIAIVRIRKRVISHYQTAQLLDKRFRLDDSISTAWFLLEHTNGTPEPIAKFQLQQAEKLAAGIEPGLAFPLAWQRAWAVSAALAVVALSLFTVRYMVTKSLSFERALIPVQISPIFERTDNPLLSSNHLPSDPATGNRAEQSTDALSTQLPDQKRTDMQGAQGEEAGQSTDPSGKAQSGQLDQSKDGKPQNGEGQSKDGKPGDQQATAQEQQQPSGDQTNQAGANSKKENASGQQSSQGLMDKMKDALSSLMAKMQQNSAQQSQQNNQASDQNKTGGQNSGKPQQGQQQDARNQQSSQEQSAEGQPQGQASERTQAGQSRSSDSMPEKGADAHSGIGRQDGDKDLKDAEQLQAMGKLAEIIGKRSANLTGDMMIETPSGKQQLKTAYSQKLGHHSDSGGEINRDDVPVADQQYVREYMELVRKQSEKTDH